MRSKDFKWGLSLLKLQNVKIAAFTHITRASPDVQNVSDAAIKGQAEIPDRAVMDHLEIN